MQPSGRVAIVGTGMVGSTIAYSILLQQTAREILLIDIAKELAIAHEFDLEDAASFVGGTEVDFVDYASLQDGDIVVVTAGAAQKEGQTRLELLETNKQIVGGILDSIKNTGKDLFIVMVTNPVDVLTYQAIRTSGLPERQVFGSGTALDTARLRMALSQMTDVSPSNIHGYILGEHGDSSFPALSAATIAGTPMADAKGISEGFQTDVQHKVRERAYQIIKGKNATYFGIGAAVTNICAAIIKDMNVIMPVSTMLHGEYGLEDVCLGVPARINSEGVEIIGEIKLSESELDLLRSSADTIRSHIQQLNLS